MEQNEKLALRAFQDADQALLRKWLYQDHVAKWYAHPSDWLDEVAKRDGQYSFLHHFIVECGGAPIGFCQYYEYCKGGETWHGEIDTAGAYSIDYLIGEATYLHKGYGKAIVAELTAMISGIPDAKRIIVQPEKGNLISRKTLLACGFAHDAAQDVFIKACPVIAICNLSFSYTKDPFIENMRFSVDKGEIFGFLGPSGAGKSTLQKILIGLLPGYSGSVRAFGREVKRHGRDFYERIGIDFEFPTLYEKLTARQNLDFFASLYGGDVRNTDELLHSVDLLRDADKKVSDYSKGMKSRLNFLRALVNDPEILFLDEPTSGLDPANARLIKNLILAERVKGKTVILTTHNMQDAQELCDRVAFIVSGNIVALDTPHALIMRRGAAKLAYAWLEGGAEQSGECALAKTGTDERLLELVRAGRLLTVHSQEPNLGDIFMEVTGRSLQ